VASNFNTLRRQLGPTPLFSPLGEEDTVAHLFVVRIEFRDGDRDIATVYRDPESLLDESRCTPTATLEGNLAFDRISLANFDSRRGQVHEVDEIRVGTSFTAVTGQRSLKEVPLAAYPFGERAAWPQSAAVLLQGVSPAISLNSSRSVGFLRNQPDVLLSREQQLATFSKWPRTALYCPGQGT